MTLYSKRKIPPAELAFDIDGVVADTMVMFVDLARKRYGLEDFTKDHIDCYDLHQCVNLDSEVLNELICITLDDEHTLRTPPVPGAPQVLSRLAQHGPLRFVTARIWPESITQWLHQTLADVPKEQIQVIATGDPGKKLQILKEMNIRFFVEDRLETCRQLAREDIQPLLFDQPWNRKTLAEEFPRVQSWSQLSEWVLPSSAALR